MATFLANEINTTKRDITSPTPHDQIVFPLGTKMWNILIWGMRVSQNFLALFLSFFSVLSLLLPFAFHVLSGYPKKLGAN